MYTTLTHASKDILRPKTNLEEHSDTTFNFDWGCIYSLPTQNKQACESASRDRYASALNNHMALLDPHPFSRVGTTCLLSL